VASWGLTGSDYPEGEVVMGVEVRQHNVKAAPVCTASGEFFGPGSAASVDAPGEAGLLDAVSRAVRAHSWRGPIGVSYTKKVRELLGGEAKTQASLEAALPETRGEIAPMIHSDAAAYAETGFGGAVGRVGRGMVVTVGANLGVALFVDGELQRRASAKHLTWRWSHDVRALRQQVRRAWEQERAEAEGAKAEVGEAGAEPDFWTGLVPEWGTPAYDEWMALLSTYLGRVLQDMKPEFCIVMPTGEVADLVFCAPGRSSSQGCEAFLGSLAGAGEQAGVELLLGQKPVGAIVKGAARGAQIALRSAKFSERAFSLMCRLYGGSPKPMQLPEEELERVFADLDKDSLDNKLTLEDLTHWGHRSGLELTEAEGKGLLRAMTLPKEENVTLESFQWWWKTSVEEAWVVHLSSEAELAGVLAKRPVSGISVLEVTSTTCRSCAKFEKTYARYAKEFTLSDDVKFLTVEGGSSLAATHLVTRLGVEATPSFIIFKGTSLKGRFFTYTGSTGERLLDHIREALEVAAAPTKTTTSAAPAETAESKSALARGQGGAAGTGGIFL